MQHFGVKTNGRMLSEGQLRSRSDPIQTIRPPGWLDPSVIGRANDTVHKCIHLVALPTDPRCFKQFASFQSTRLGVLHSGLAP